MDDIIAFMIQNYAKINCYKIYKIHYHYFLTKNKKKSENYSVLNCLSFTTKHLVRAGYHAKVLSEYLSGSFLRK